MGIEWEPMPWSDGGGVILVANVGGLELQTWEEPDGVGWRVERGQMLAGGSIREGADGRAVFEPAGSTVLSVENIVDRSRWIRAAQSAALCAACRIVREDATALQRLAAELSRAAGVA